MSRKAKKYDLVSVGKNDVVKAEPMPETAESEPESEKDTAGEAPPNKIGRKYDKWLRCDLTEEEKRHSAARLVNRMEDLSRKEAELDSIKNQFKGEISRIEADIEMAKNLVRDGYEMRDVQVLEERNYDTETLTITRMDTFEIVEERRMRGDELQRPLF